MDDNTISRAEEEKYPNHPWYGPCDAIADGECAECRRIVVDLRLRLSKKEEECKKLKSKIESLEKTYVRQDYFPTK